jgi:hypothetical protein
MSSTLDRTENIAAYSKADLPLAQLSEWLSKVYQVKNHQISIAN